MGSNHRKSRPSKSLITQKSEPRGSDFWVLKEYNKKERF